MKALIVDFGGVMTTSIFDSFAAFCGEHGVDPSHLRTIFGAQMYAHHEDNTTPLHQVETGQLTAQQWEVHLSEMLSEGLKIPLSPTGLKGRMFAAVRPEPRMVETVLEVRRGGRKTALLSNTWGGESQLREVFKGLFDEVLLSHEVGLRKPQPEIFLLAAGRLGIDPVDCVFVDDVKVNVEGAQAVGMTGVWHTDPDITIPALEQLFR